MVAAIAVRGVVCSFKGPERLGVVLLREENSRATRKWARNEAEVVHVAMTGVYGSVMRNVSKERGGNAR